MFGMEHRGQEKKTKAVATFEYDFEQEMRKPVERKKLEMRCAELAPKFKTFLRSGLESEAYDEMMTLFNGYGALVKVITNLAKKNKKS